MADEISIEKRTLVETEELHTEGIQSSELSTPPSSAVPSASKGGNPDLVKVSMNLRQGDIEALDDISGERGVSKTEALRGAIATENFLREEIRKGAKIVIERPGARRREVFFR